jgi:hypothetical protein
MISDADLNSFVSGLQIDVTLSAKEFIKLLVDAVDLDGGSKWPNESKANLDKHSKDFEAVLLATVRYYATQLQATPGRKMTLFDLLGYLRGWVGGMDKLLLKIDPLP